MDGDNFVLLGDVELKELVPIIGHRAKISHLRDSAEYYKYILDRLLFLVQSTMREDHTRSYKLQTKTHGTGLLMLTCLFGRPRGMAAQAGLTMTGSSASRWHSTVACGIRQ